MNDKYFSILENSAVFSEVAKKEIKNIFNFSQIISCKKNSYLFREDDEGNNFYIILEGSISVRKKDSDKESTIAELHPGNMVGGMAYFSGAKRSASILCLTDCTFLMLEKKLLQTRIQSARNREKLHANIGALISGKLDSTNTKYINRLKENLALSEKSVKKSKSLITIIILMSFLSIFNAVAAKLSQSVSSTTLLTLPLMLVIVFFTLYQIKMMGLPASDYGFTLKNWRSIIFKVFLICIPICLLALLAKWLLIMFAPAYADASLFTQYAGINSTKYNNPGFYWLLNISIYIVLVAPIQEIMVRTGLQAPLSHILESKNKNFLAILATSLVFSVAHLFMSPYIFIMVFLTSLIFGWVFYLYKTLLAPILCHIIIGFWGLYVIGFTIYK